MTIVPMPIRGAFVIDVDRHEDSRGFFARTFCRAEFAERGLAAEFVQSSVSFNHQKGILRGMHFQTTPHEETRLVRCTMGAIYDVVLDLRSASPTFKQSAAFELSADNHRAVYVPQGCAHGFLTLTDNCEVLYDMSVPYHPQCAAGVRWNDPAFSIAWPADVTLVSERDRHFSDWAG